MSLIFSTSKNFDWPQLGANFWIFVTNSNNSHIFQYQTLFLNAFLASISFQALHKEKFSFHMNILSPKLFTKSFIQECGHLPCWTWLPLIFLYSDWLKRSHMIRYCTIIGYQLFIPSVCNRWLLAFKLLITSFWLWWLCASKSIQNRTDSPG